MFAKTIVPFALSLALCGGAAAQRVANAEYFWDTDPGAGNGTAMTAEDGAFDEALERIFLDAATLPGMGAHTIAIRVRDEDNNWGPVFRTTVVIEPAVITAPDIAVVEAEYFWDTDPGEGNGTPMLAFDGDFNAALEAISMETSALPVEGAHVLHVRTIDVNTVWSAPFSVVVEVLGGSVTFPEISVSIAEYYVNTDPGAGNGTPMLAVDGNFNSALEAIKGGGIPAPVAAGVNVLWTRAKDVNDVWGPSFGVVVNIDTTITGTVGLEEVSSDITTRLIPNPTNASDGFDVIMDAPQGVVRVQVMDAAGRVVAEHSPMAARRFHVALPNAAPGLYHIGLFMDGSSHWHRLMVQ